MICPKAVHDASPPARLSEDGTLVPRLSASNRTVTDAEDSLMGLSASQSFANSDIRTRIGLCPRPLGSMTCRFAVTRVLRPPLRIGAGAPSLPGPNSQLS
jgi:hypothetical protein